MYILFILFYFVFNRFTYKCVFFISLASSYKMLSSSVNIYAGCSSALAMPAFSNRVVDLLNDLDQDVIDSINVDK